LEDRQRRGGWRTATTGSSRENEDGNRQRTYAPVYAM
jgi:hypothetical protein